MPGKYVSTNHIQSEHLSDDTMNAEFEEFDDIMQKSILVDEGIRNSDILSSIAS